MLPPESPPDPGVVPPPVWPRQPPRTFGAATAEEHERPPLWRFWQALPAKGKIGVLFGNPVE